MKKELGSTCCGAQVTDNGLCSDCKEHCGTIVNEIVSVWVLDTMHTKVIRMVIPLQYDLDDSDQESEVIDFVAEKLGHSSFSYLYNEDKEIEFDDLDYT